MISLTFSKGLKQLIGLAPSGVLGGIPLASKTSSSDTHTLLRTVLGHIGGCPKFSVLPVTSTGSKIYLQGDKLMGDQEKSSEMSDV